jgi:hypothetical protein
VPQPTTLPRVTKKRDQDQKIATEKGRRAWVANRRMLQNTSKENRRDAINAKDIRQ